MERLSIFLWGHSYESVLVKMFVGGGSMLELITWGQKMTLGQFLLLFVSLPNSQSVKHTRVTWRCLYPL